MRGHGLSHHVTGETARQDLMDLERRGLLDKSKLGRRFVWSPAVDLKEKLGG